MSNHYGGLFHIPNLEPATVAERLERVSLKAGRTAGGYDEKWLQRLVSSHPQALPIAEIEAYLADAVPICLELGTAAGPVDVLLVSPQGDIVIVECKLWRNPQARREVIGQIIDYAKELPRLSYEAFEAAVRRAEAAAGHAGGDGLYARTGAERQGVEEAHFIDSVSRNLRRGRFLLLIVGDGIQEGVESITEFLQQHAGMHFTLALVEVAVFAHGPSGYLVQPRVLMKTQMVTRGVVSIESDAVSVQPASVMPAGRPSTMAGAAHRDNARVPSTISEARLYEALEMRVPAGSLRLRELVSVLEDEAGAAPRFTSTTIVLQGKVGDSTMTLATIDAASATVWFENVVEQASKLGMRAAALRYYNALAALVIDEKLRSRKLNPNSKTGTASLPANDLLVRQTDWLAAIRAYRSELRSALPG